MLKFQQLREPSKYNCIVLRAIYSQTRCSFDGNFANFRRNIGILVDSLSRASCSVHLVPDGKNLLRFSKIFQYFEDRFASFNVNEPLHEQLPRYSRLRGKICTVCCRCFEMIWQSLLLLIRWLSKLQGTVSYVLAL